MSASPADPPRVQAFFGPAGHEALAFAQGLFESLDVEQTYWRIARDAAQVLGRAQSLVYDYDHGANLLTAVAASPRLQDHVGRRVSLGERRPTREAPCEDLADVDDILPSRRARRLREWLTERTALVVPLSARTECIGLLLVVAEEGRSFSDEEAAFVVEFGRLASSALHNARLYRNAMRGQGRLEGMLTRMSQAREQERKTYAATVHDDVLQPMVGVIYALDAIRESVTDEGLSDFDHVLRMLRLSVEDARKIIWDLRPAVLDGLGLSEAVGAIADRIAVEGPAEVLTQLAEIGRLNEGQSTAIYKIAREALLNAERHAGAAHIEVRLALEGECGSEIVRLLVQDDGRGFDAAGKRPRGHYGLTMMEEQAAAVGGVLRIESHPGRGSTVELTLPLVRAVHEEGR